jgi:hypothetical protein
MIEMHQQRRSSSDNSSAFTVGIHKTVSTSLSTRVESLAWLAEASACQPPRCFPRGLGVENEPKVESQFHSRVKPTSLSTASNPRDSPMPGSPWSSSISCTSGLSVSHSARHRRRCWINFPPIGTKANFKFSVPSLQLLQLSSQV